MAEDALIALIQLAVFYGAVMLACSSLNGAGRDEL